jgi:hypothetical protein
MHTKVHLKKNPEAEKLDGEESEIKFPIGKFWDLGLKSVANKSDEQGG